MGACYTYLMLIIDAQVHLWAGAGSSPRHGSTPFRVTDALAGMDEAGVTAAVIHPPGWDPGSVDYAAAAVAAHPDRFATYATLALDHPDAPAHLTRLRTTPGVLGLRFLCLAPEERTWPTDGTMAWMFAMAEKFDLPVALCGPTLMPIVAAVAARHPDLRLVVDHFGLAGYAEDGGLVRHPDVLAWARYPNVAVKLTGAPDYATDRYPFPGMRAVVHAFYDAYGPARLFWGTDITRVDGHGGTRHKATWRECVTMFTEHMPFLSATDLELVMGRAHAEWHGWWPR
jgi:predicted TIM-barrel fold metal-dependent hydrolase